MATPTATIIGAFETAEKVLPRHAVGFYEQRPAGSQWGAHIPKDPLEWGLLNWMEMGVDDLPPGAYTVGCRYFRTESPLLLDGAVEHIGVSSELDHSLIQLREGNHGLELVTTQELPKAPAKEAWLILGPYKEHGLIPWTAFPGRMTRGIVKGEGGVRVTLETLDLKLPYAVKQIAGSGKIDKKAKMVFEGKSSFCVRESACGYQVANVVVAVDTDINGLPGTVGVNFPEYKVDADGKCHMINHYPEDEKSEQWVHPKLACIVGKKLRITIEEIG